MAEPAPIRPGASDLTGRQLGRYEVLKQLASGGMATVYVARAQGVAGFERLVAVKVLHPHLAHDEDFISMFLDEARLAARIRHPNVVGTLDISDTQGDGYFLVMEYVEGDHFGALLRNAARGAERLPVPVVARIVMDALSGLYAAHNLTDSTGAPLDLVHRDVSPHNILVGADGIARITDFGVAKAQVRLSSTRDGQFKGKLSYMAPEQASHGEASQRSDLFSMGIVLWEALTGRRLFRGENNADVLNKILNAEVPRLSELDPALAPFDEVAATALAKDPADRFASAEEFVEAVEEAAATLGGVGTPRSVGREVKRWLQEKIEAERESIRDAMDALGRSELKPGVLPRPMESGSQPSMPYPRPVALPDSDLGDMTVGAKPSTLAGEPLEPKQKRSAAVWVAAIAVVLLFLVGGVAAALLMFGGDPPPAAPPAPVEPAIAEGADPGEPPASAEADETGTDETGTDEAQTDEAQTDGTEVADTAGDEAEADEAETAAEASPAPRRGRRGTRRAGRRTGSRGGARAGGDEDENILVNPYRR